MDKHLLIALNMNPVSTKAYILVIIMDLVAMGQNHALIATLIQLACRVMAMVLALVTNPKHTVETIHTVLVPIHVYKKILLVMEQFYVMDIIHV